MYKDIFLQECQLIQCVPNCVWTNCNTVNICRASAWNSVITVTSPCSCMQHLWTPISYSSIAAMLVTPSTLVDSLGFCWMTSSNYGGVNRSSFSRGITSCLGRPNWTLWCLINSFDDDQSLFIYLLLLTHIYKSPFTTLNFLKSSICIFTLWSLKIEFTSVCFEDLNLTALQRWSAYVHPF
jgi:hypothetical protein